MYEIKLKDSDEVITSVDRYLYLQENKAATLTFSLLPNSPYFKSMKKFKTKIRLYKDDVMVFDGRVIDIQKSINSDKIPVITVTCESVLNYLNDSRVGKWEIHPNNYESSTSDDDIIVSDEEKANDPFEVHENMSVTSYLQLLLNNHNSKVKSDKKIYLGNVTVTGDVYCYNSRETTLNAIYDKLINRKGGFLSIRNVNDINYLDYLSEVDETQGLIELGVNVLTYSNKDSLEAIYTRIIPIGADGLTIKSVNNNVEYVQDDDLVAEYGIVETVVKWEDVTVASNLKSKAEAMLSTINNYQNIFDINVVDISYINDNFTDFRLSQKCKIKNSIFNDDEIQRIVAIDINLDDPERDTKITLSALSYSSISTTNNIIQNQQNIDINREVTEEAIRQRVAKGQFNSYFEQTAQAFNFTIGDPAGDTNVIIDKTGLTVKNGAIAIKNNAGKTVFWVNSNGYVSLDGVETIGDGDKFINFKSNDNNAVFVYLQSGNNASRIGYYKDNPNLFIESNGKIIMRGINSTPTENVNVNVEVHGNIGVTGVVKQNVAEGWESS